MSVSAISSAVSAAIQPELHKAAPASVASQPAASSPTDTVSLSAAAQKASQAGDVDRDGDSH
jgi:hypothetical protein